MNSEELGQRLGSAQLLEMGRRKFHAFDVTVRLTNTHRRLSYEIGGIDQSLELRIFHHFLHPHLRRHTDNGVVIATIVYNNTEYSLFNIATSRLGGFHNRGNDLRALLFGIDERSVAIPYHAQWRFLHNGMSSCHGKKRVSL